MNRFDRVFSILILLQTKKIIKAATISERFSISLRTVYRDIKALKNAGIPIVGDPGIGYSIVSGYRIPPLMFTNEETSALMAAQKFIGKVTDKETQEDYANAMLKIKAILRSSEKQSLELLEESIAVSEYANREDKTHLQNIFKSIASKRIIEIQYRNMEGADSQRNVEPIGCYHRYDNWYLVAYCQLKSDYRTFKVNRVVRLILKDDQFDKKHMSLQQYIERQDESWRQEQNFSNIEVEFTHTFAKFAQRRKYYFGFVEETIEEDVVRMKFVNSSLEIIARWLLQFGDQATVLAPVELKDRLKVLSNQLYNHYH